MVKNYIAQLNGFRDRRLRVPLSTAGICLYFILLEYCNRLCWQEWFTVPNSILQGLTGMSDSSVHRAREELIQSGYIAYKKGTGRQCGSYYICELDRQQGDDLPVGLSVCETGNLTTLNKQKQKRKRKEGPPSSNPFRDLDLGYREESN